MSRRYIERITSDLSGEEGAHSVTVHGFALDLTDAEETQLNELLAPYRAKGVKLTGSGGQPQPSPKVRAGHSNSRALKSDRQKMREWLETHGYVPSARGRVSGEQVEAYRLKTPAPGWVDPELVKRTVTPAVTVGDVLFSEAEAQEAPVEAPPKAPRARKTAAPKASTVTPIKAAKTAKAAAAKAAAEAAKVAPAKATAAAGRSPRKTTTAKVATGR